MSEEFILVEREGDIATVILNRPEKLNALIKPMWQQLGEVMRSLSDDDSLRCIVLRGAGDRSFVPGNDISEFKDARSNSKNAKAYGEIHHASLDSDGAVRLSDGSVLSSETEATIFARPVLAIDSSDDVHLVFERLEFLSETTELLYLMVDGESGEKLIDATLLTPDDGRSSSSPSIGMNADDEVSCHSHIETPRRFWSYWPLRPQPLLP